MSETEFFGFKPRIRYDHIITPIRQFKGETTVAFRHRSNGGILAEYGCSGQRLAGLFIYNFTGNKEVFFLGDNGERKEQSDNANKKGSCKSPLPSFHF